MSDLITGFKILANQYRDVGGKFLKSMAIELFLETYKGELVERLANSLRLLNPAELPRMVRENVAFPIDESFFVQCVGFEEYIEKFPIERFFEEFLVPANPLISAAIIDMGDDGADYLVKFKKFFLDSVKAESAKRKVEESIEEKPPETTPETTQEVEEVNPIPQTQLRMAPRVKVAEATPKKMKRLTCSSCNQSWDVPEDQLEKIKECPFCHEPA